MTCENLNYNDVTNIFFVRDVSFNEFDRLSNLVSKGTETYSCGRHLIIIDLDFQRTLSNW